MKQVYLVKENPGEENPRWVQMNMQQFHHFIKTPESEGRFFVRFPKLTDTEEDFNLRIETDKDFFLREEQERKLELYKRTQEDAIGVEIYPYLEIDEPNLEDAERFIKLQDPDQNVEQNAQRFLMQKSVWEAMDSLSPLERNILIGLFWEKLSERECAEFLGLSRALLRRHRDHAYAVMRPVLQDIYKAFRSDYDL